MRLLLKTVFWLLIAAVIAGAAACWAVSRRSRQMDRMIERAADARGLDARLFAALVAHTGGTRTTLATNGHYGLLLLTEADGRAWAAAMKQTFDAFDLFDPRKNLEVGAWKFDASLREWAREKDAAVWAVASWRTNRETVRAWADAARSSTNPPLASIPDIPLRMYVRDVLLDAKEPAPHEFDFSGLWRRWRGMGDG